MERRRWHFGSLVLSILLLSGSGSLLAEQPSSGVSKPSESDYELYQIFADTLDQIERNYVKEVSRRELIEAAIEGVLEKLDPYSNYINPEEINRFRTSVEHKFGGIGIQIGMEDGQLKVISPLLGTPAYRAGLESGDAILEIDGRSTEGIQIDEAVKQLKGDPDTKVTLTIRHAGSREKEKISVTREIVRVETVLGDTRKSDDTWDFMLDHDKHIGYIRITAFGRETPKEVKHALDELQKEGLKGLIIDLRFNPGGLLSAAIDISDLFISSGKIVSTKGRNTAERSWDAHKDGTYEGFPMVVLVNHYSASASEIFSAAMQDHDRAVVIGERTWGKGSVQHVIDLEDGRSALKLTTAGYHRPSGKNIHRYPNADESEEWGVMPDEGQEVKMTGSQIARLIEYRRRRDILVGKHEKALANADDSEAATEEAAEVKSDAQPAEGSETPAEESESKDANSNDANSNDDKPAADKQQPADAQPATEDEQSETGDAKPDAAPPADHPAGDSEKGDSEKGDGEKGDGEKGEANEETDDADPDKDDSLATVDPQLQRAIDYLSTELAKAE